MKRRKSGCAGEGNEERRKADEMVGILRSKPERRD
jgi:hypothetical protein